MKKKIAILLAAVMTSAMVPMNVMASSSNSVNKTVTVAVDKAITGVYLNVTPNDEISSGDTIAITVDGGDFIKAEGEDIDGKTYNIEQYSVKGADGETYDWDAAQAYGDSDSFIKNVLTGASSELPFYIKRNGANEIQVSLYAVSSDLVGSKVNNNDTKLYYKIPLNIKAKSTGDIKVTVDANETSISGGGTYTIATATSSSGSTTTTVEDVKSFEDTLNVKPITVKEDVMDSFEAGKEVTLRLSGGFNFKNGSTFKIAPGINANFDSFTVTVKKEDDEVTFDLPSDFKATKACAFRIEDLKVVADDEDDDWGEVKLTISGAGITKETLVIGNRADFGFALTVLDEVPTIIAGRFENGDGSGKVYDDDCETAQFKFEETIPNTWLTQRKLEFTVPDGIKIYDYEIEDDENINSNIDQFVSLTNDGTTIKIDKGIDLDADGDDCAEFKLKLYISADADFEGDVTVSVSGGGVAAGEVDDIVVANVIAPLTITATETKTNMGYQAVATSDITLTEAQEGIFLKGEEVYVDLDSSFGTNEIGFADNGIDYTIDGELQIKDFDVKDGSIKFKVDKASYNEPASITFTNVMVGTTRSVPYGSYDIKVSGLGIINNYTDDNNFEDNEDFGGNWVGFFDTTDSYTFKNYLTIGTVTGTLDAVVKVTIGEKTILIDDEAQDMDVAPYIQASSNSTMVPLRFVAVALGVDPSSISNPDESSKVSWNSNTKTVTIYYGAGTSQKIIQFTAGSNNMVVDGTTIPMDYGVTAEIKDDRMFVPFRALGNALGVNVKWDADTKTATYNAQ